MRWALLPVLLVASCATRASPKAGVLVTSARAELTAAGSGVVFLTVQNLGARGETLLSAESAAAQRIALHDVRQTGDIMTMTDLPHGLPIAAREKVVLAPGGKHLMLEGVALPAGAERLPLTLHFLHAGAVRIQADVQRGLASR